MYMNMYNVLYSMLASMRLYFPFLTKYMYGCLGYLHVSTCS